MADSRGVMIWPRHDPNPSGPVSGQTFFDTGDNTYRGWNGTNFIDLGFGGAQSVFQGILTPAQITADQNDYNPANLSTATILRLSSDTPFRALTGIAGGAAGRMLVLVNAGTSVIQLRRESASSTAANRFGFPADLRLEPQASITIHYDATLARWITFDSIFPDRIDPTTPTELVDDFLTVSTETGEMGALGWLWTNAAPASLAAPAGVVGVARITSNATANAVNDVRLVQAAGNAAFAYDQFDEMFFRLAPVAIGADFTVRFGICGDPTANPPASGVFIERLSTDTAYFGVARNTGAQTRTGAGLFTLVAGSYQTFRIRRVNATTVGFSVNRGAEVQVASNVPAAATVLQFFLQIVPTTAAARSMDWDFFSARLQPQSARW